ncbi:MAG TPA: hypothetical protein VK612_11615 [Pyrinomonadaceae bacterium]|nr:hypothetical protein [Pyrinomonadaceae bacterium]
MNNSVSERADGGSKIWQILRSVFAVIVGLLLAIILSMVTDYIIERAIGRLLLSNGELFISLIYRVVYAIFASYVTAVLAPSRPMLHALIPGIVGMIPWLLGMFMMWNVVPKWFMPTGLVTSILFAWIGGKLREMQLRSRSAEHFERA